MLVACIVLMAQLGMFVPADFANIRCVDHIVTRIGASDNIETNSSTMMSEMQVHTILQLPLRNRHLSPGKPFLKTYGSLYHCLASSGIFDFQACSCSLPFSSR